MGTDDDRTTSATSFEVLEDALMGTPTPICEVYKMSGNILRMFRFDNLTKAWDFKDRRAELADTTTLDELVSGGVYWLLIDQDVLLIIEGVELDLTCTEGDCWNLVVWP